MRRYARAAGLLVGVILGYGIATIAASPQGRDPADTPVAGDPAHFATTTAAPGTTEPRAETYLIWSTGGLTAELIDGLRETFSEVSIVGGDPVELEAEDDMVIPLDGLAISPTDHAWLDPDGALAVLSPGSVVLGESSARIRQREVGDELVIGDTRFEIAGIVADDIVAAAEVVFSRDDPSAPVVTERFALVRSELPRPDLEALVRDLYDGPAPLRIRAAGETPWMRHGDAVLPQVLIKAALGEFAYRRGSGADIEQDAAFVDANIISADVPILGRVVCHEVLVSMLTTAMNRLIEEGLSHLVDPAGFAGCWNPRFIRPTVGASSGISRHAWGAAVDLNSRTNSIGSAGNQDPRLVEIMLEAGFTWGGDWLVPDPMHFEFGMLP